MDIYKAFDKVLDKGLLYKLKTYGVKGKVLNILHNYLHERYKTVDFYGKTSSWKFIESGVSERFVLGPFMILSFINDLPNNIQSACKISADDIFLFSIASDKYTSYSEMNNDLRTISIWTSQWKMQFNSDRNKQAQQVYFFQKT